MFEDATKKVWYLSSEVLASFEQLGPRQRLHIVGKET